MIRRAEEHRKEYLSAKEGKNGRDWQQSSLFHALMASRLPEAEKRPKRMAHEGFEILLAGSDTAARTMGVAIYHILANPEIKCRLQVELDTAIPNSYDQIELRVLEQLPFLVSCPAKLALPLQLTSGSLPTERCVERSPPNRKNHRPSAHSHCAK